MTLKPVIRVAGFDIAAVHSGLVAVEARLAPKRQYPPIEWTLMEEQAVRCEQTLPGRIEFALNTRSLVRKWDIDLVVIEDTIKRFGASNTTGLQQAELLSLVKYFMYEEGLPILMVNPSSMRSFMGVGTKANKGDLMDAIFKRYNFTSTQSRKGERSNVSDAFAHAMIGACSYYAREGKMTADLSIAEKNVLYGDKGKRLAMIEAHVLKKKEL